MAVALLLAMMSLLPMVYTRGHHPPDVDVLFEPHRKEVIDCMREPQGSTVNNINNCLVVSTKLPQTEWPWCRVLSKHSPHPPHADYEFNITVMNVYATPRAGGPDTGQHTGQFGLAFNVRDEDDFDYIMIRFKDSVCKAGFTDCLGKCVQWGYVEEGEVMEYGKESKHCHHANLEGGRDIHLSLRVEDGEARLTVGDDELHATVNNPKYPTRSHVGLLLPGGYNNEIKYCMAHVYKKK